MQRNVYNGPGRALYEAHREAYKRPQRNRGLNRLPRWKELKPWQAKLWNDTALALGSAYDNPLKYGQHLADH